MLRRFFPSETPTRRGPEGWRAYAVGDIHGRLDLLDRLLKSIADDHAARPPAKGLLVFLGDLIDRGPQSAEVVERVRTLELPGFRTVALAGNHEDAMRRVLGGEAGEIAGWLRFGGIQTLASYGCDAVELARLAPSDAQKRIAAAIPQADHRFLADLADSFRFGDYLFVHAGIRPGVPLDQQSAEDLRWIREPFLSDRRDHGMTVVHGHTISEEVQVVGSRIGIDTGAYATGWLTALAIEGAKRWLLDTADGLTAKSHHV